MLKTFDAIRMFRDKDGGAKSYPIDIVCNLMSQSPHIGLDVFLFDLIHKIDLLTDMHMESKGYPDNLLTRLFFKIQ